MAEKRMFTQKIIDSDAFLDMPLSTQALYFHLNMRADDDGFVNNPKRIQRTIGASEDDLKLLVLKRFVIGFECGVIVIKHWRMHNTLKKDRYNPTQYQDELALLEVKDNKAYTERCIIEAAELVCLPDGNQVEPEWNQNGTRLEPQYSKDKNSIDKISIEKENGDSGESVSCQQIVDLYHKLCTSYPRVRSLSEARKKAIKARLKTYKPEDFKTVFENAENSSFLKGKNDRNWMANFDWLIADKNMAKVLEGNYADRYGHREKVPDWLGKRELDDVEQEAVRRMMSDDDQAEADQLRRELQESFGRGRAGMDYAG